MKGFVYILTNKAYPDLVKVGETSGNPEERAAQLSNTSVPYPFKVYGFVEVDDPKGVEQRTHRKLVKYRESSNREYFRIDPKAALQMLEEVSGEVEYMRREKAKRAREDKKNKAEREKKKNLASRVKKEREEFFHELLKKTNYDLLNNTARASGVICICSLLAIPVGLFLVYDELQAWIVLGAIPICIVFTFITKFIEARRDDCADSVENEVNRILPSIEYDERNVIPSLSEK